MCPLVKCIRLLAIHREPSDARKKINNFVRPGQPAFSLRSQGVPLDAICRDFMAGSIEQLTPDNDSGHWE